MHYPQRVRLPHEVPPWVAEGGFFFITINCQPRGFNQLCRAGIGEAVLAAAAHYHVHLRWHCRLVVLMPDHLHGIIAFPPEPGLKATVTAWKQYLARVHSVCWQRDFFDHRLRDHHEEAAKIDYIQKNPVRRDLCEQAEE
jgi:REP element-mobilizing transposase RayT